MKRKIITVRYYGLKRSLLGKKAESNFEVRKPVCCHYVWYHLEHLELTLVCGKQTPSVPATTPLSHCKIQQTNVLLSLHVSFSVLFSN